MPNRRRDAKIVVISSWKLSVALLAGAVVVAFLGGIGRGSLLGGFLALAAAVPAGFGIWKGMQAESQWPTAKHMVALLLALAIAGCQTRRMEWVYRSSLRDRPASADRCSLSDASPQS